MMEWAERWRRLRAGRIWAPLGCVCLLLLVPGARAQQQPIVSGVVLDSSGRPVSGAEIEFRSASGTSRATTNPDGAFDISAAGAGTLRVAYPGFRSVTLTISPDSTAAERMEVRLFPAPNVQRIVVSAVGDERIAAVPSSQFAIPVEQMRASGSLVLDDILRQAPGFSLFRRSGSLFANPTAQGVSLRGLGAGSASRALVLVDGVPLNDPFGGWVYWNRVPAASIRSIEVLNGGASDSYGTGALGGIVNLGTRRLTESFASVEASYGNEKTPNLSFHAGWARGPWGIGAAGQALRTTGYVIVDPSQRGPVDTPAGTGDLVGSLQLSRKLGDRGYAFLRAASFAESRRNGTPLQTNNTRIPSADLGADWNSSAAGAFSLRLYGSYGIFNQNFSAVAAGRASESLTNRQRSPSQQVGLAGQWQRTFASRHTITSVLETRVVRGHSAETTFSPAGPTALVDAGGRQRAVGFLAQDVFHFAPNWSVTFGGRVDGWLNSRGFSNRTPLTAGAPTASTFPDRSETAFSPRLSLLRTFENGVALSASVYRAFRAPTLNELYRNFRVGSVVTNANPSLRAERLTGGEAGISMRAWDGRLTSRGTFFWSDITNLVASVTLTSTPTLITRQRQNTGVARARGAELSVEMRLPGHLQLSSEYLLTDSTILRFPANTALEGLWIPQVPRHQVHVQLGYSGEKWSAGLQGRFVGKQFDDDQNAFPLDRFFTLDAQISRRLRPQVTLFAAAQNLTNVRYQVGRTPVLTIGPPALARGGIRFHLP
jgi:outer membrane receptor protein involved in Fe transport